MSAPVLLIGPSSLGAGSGQEPALAVLQEAGIPGVLLPTALLAWQQGEVFRTHSIPPRFLAAAFDALVGERRPGAVYLGDLDRPEMVRTVLGRFRRHELPNLVLDVRLVDREGRALLSAAGVLTLRECLSSRVSLVTGTVLELRRLSGLRGEHSAETCAEYLRARGAQTVAWWKRDGVSLFSEAPPGARLYSADPAYRARFSLLVAAQLASGLCPAEALEVASRSLVPSIPGDGSGPAPRPDLPDPPWEGPAAKGPAR